MTNASTFDVALAASLAGRNRNSDNLASSQAFEHQSYQQGLDAFALDSATFEGNVSKAKLGLDTSMQGFGNDVTGLSAADASFRASSDFGLQTNMDNADLGLKNALAGNDFSFQQSQINTQAEQYKVDQESNFGMNFLQGVSQVALWATNPGVAAGLTGFGNWLGSLSPTPSQTPSQTQSPYSSYGGSN